MIYCYPSLCYSSLCYCALCYCCSVCVLVYTHRLYSPCIGALFLTQPCSILVPSLASSWFSLSLSPSPSLPPSLFLSLSLLRVRARAHVHSFASGLVHSFASGLVHSFASGLVGCQCLPCWMCSTLLSHLCYLIFVISFLLSHPSAMFFSCECDGSVIWSDVPPMDMSLQGTWRWGTPYPLKRLAGV